MEEAKGSVVKHVFVAKFKDETSAAQIDQLIREMANLVNLIEPMKSLDCLASSALLHENIYKRVRDATEVNTDKEECKSSTCMGMDVSAGKKNQGFTHVFECTFESMEGIAEYVAHPAHKEYAKTLMPNVEKFQVFDYELTKAVI
ncbi:stress-response A/B barrel domain-containing protein HS1-like isoform X1 [Juglans microcarpa x Juglans regia]|uniref:stress-response A/B barrel domain-containing protein HS1-like isoform X1 n=1 Tax=Juglans microcarpa x Juglans regia TaxID=2249226 RepID=UPI001B7DB28B|nr:stress-response A/B barrel domain-containing protein HS1-like isoform X1 [Juglans microcarpa x Juglans regia]